MEKWPVSEEFYVKVETLKFQQFYLVKFKVSKKGFSNLEPEGQGRGIIMGVTRLLLLGPFYTIQMQFYILFCTRLYIYPIRRLEISDKLSIKV